MTTIKQKTFYWVVYTCLNCEDKMYKEVDFGKFIPHYSNYKNDIEKGYCLAAPQCNYCGCDQWSDGKKKE